MNPWASLLPEQRAIYRPLAVKPKKKPSREKMMHDAALRSAKARAQRELHQAKVDALVELARVQKPGVSQAEALEAKRVELGVKKIEFARILGIDKRDYSDILAGRITLNLAASRRAFALGVDAVVLLAGNVKVTGLPQCADGSDAKAADCGRSG